MSEIDPALTRAKAKAEAALLKIPGVTGVDVGYKEVNGEKTNVIAIRVLVEKKKKTVPASERVPDEIDGHPTDVIERKFELQDAIARMKVEDLVLQADAAHYTPLKGGISIGPCRAVGGYVYVGTLGAIVRDNATGNPMMLSNFHVMCIDAGWHAGDTQAQPGLVDAGSCPADVVGALQRCSLGGEVDCAVADVTLARPTACEIVDIGAIAGIAVASLGDPVRKRGRTTGLTYGIVDSVQLTTTINYGPSIGNKTLTNQIGVKPDPVHNAKFGDHGDSGSAVVNNSRHIVGLHFAGDSTGYGIANPIAAVLTALNISLCVPAKSMIKDVIDNKARIKDLKDKPEFKERKEHKLEKLEFVEGKGFKEWSEKGLGPKEKDGKELVEGPGRPGLPPLIRPGGPIEERVNQLEQTVIELSHFITGDLRPDLGTGALASEADLAALSAELTQQVATAKDAKDAKDTEKLSERFSR